MESPAPTGAGRGMVVVMRINTEYLDGCIIDTKALSLVIAEEWDD